MGRSNFLNETFSLFRCSASVLKTSSRLSIANLIYCPKNISDIAFPAFSLLSDSDFFAESDFFKKSAPLLNLFIIENLLLLPSLCISAYLFSTMVFNSVSCLKFFNVIDFALNFWQCALIMYFILINEVINILC